MSLRIAEVDQDTIAHVLRDEPAEAANRLRDAFLIGRNDLAQVLRVHAGREGRRADEVREHYRDLTTFGGVLGGRFWSGRDRYLALRTNHDWRSTKLSDCAQHFPAMP